MEILTLIKACASVLNEAEQTAFDLEDLNDALSQVAFGKGEDGGRIARMWPIVSRPLFDLGDRVDTFLRHSGLGHETSAD